MAKPKDVLAYLSHEALVTLAVIGLIVFCALPLIALSFAERFIAFSTVTHWMLVVLMYVLEFNAAWKLGRLALSR